MSSTFDPQILVEKLAKLNCSQQSVETLSQWCILYIKKAKQVVETWARQFRCSPRDQRLAFLYLANDILQNSRRKGSEFVGEFWKVLPEALHDVIDNTDGSGRNAALRLVKIWEERKVFGSRGQILKEELVGRHKETSNRNEKYSALKPLQSAGYALDKIVSGYQYIYGGQIDEDAIINKCKITASCIEKVEKEFGDDLSSAQVNGLGTMEELRVRNATLKDCIEQLSAVEVLRINLVCYLREALEEQEMKLDQVSNELKAAQIRSEKADDICRQLLNPVGTKLHPGTGEQSAPIMSTQQIPISDQPNDDNKNAAAAVAAKLTASDVLSSFASEGVISNSVKESSSVDYPPEKRAKIENVQNPQPPVPSEPPHDQQPPPPTSPLPLPPVPPMQAYPVPPFLQTAGSLMYGYTNQLPPLSLPRYPIVGPPINSGGSFTPALPPTAYQSYPMEGGFSTQPMSPMPRQ